MRIGGYGGSTERVTAFDLDPGAQIGYDPLITLWRTRCCCSAVLTRVLLHQRSSSRCSACCWESVRPFLPCSLWSAAISPTTGLRSRRVPSTPSIRGRSSPTAAERRAPVRGADQVASTPGLSKDSGYPRPVVIPGEHSGCY